MQNKKANNIINNTNEENMKEKNNKEMKNIIKDKESKDNKKDNNEINNNNIEEDDKENKDKNENNKENEKITELKNNISEEDKKENHIKIEIEENKKNKEKDNFIKFKKENEDINIIVEKDIKEIKDDKSLNEKNKIKNEIPNNNQIIIKDTFEELYINNKSNSNISISQTKISIKTKINANIEFTQKIKYNSPICNKCFRFIYISFNYIKNYIITYCLYCKNIEIYTYEQFIERIEENNNPLLNSICSVCKTTFIFSEEKNKFYLIEKNLGQFSIICEKCLKSKKNYEKKIIQCKELLEHYLYLYDNGEKENILDELKKRNSDFAKNDKDILISLKNFELFNKHISIIEEILKYYSLPLSLRQKVENKIAIITKDIKIKNKIIEYYN